MGLGQFQDVASKFNRGDLHSKTEAKVRDIIFAGERGCLNFTFDPALAKTAGHEDAAKAFQMFFRAIAFEILGIYLLDFDAAIVGDTTVNDRFVNGFVSVLQFNVFANDTDTDAMLRS